MSLPKKAEKEYLAVERSERGDFIVARKQDADALAALFLQYGMSCEREPDLRPGEDTLRFPVGMDRGQVERLLDGYKRAKGS